MRRGLTVAELALVMAIMGTLLGIAIPRAARLLDRIRVAGASAEISASFATARNGAIARSERVAVTIDSVQGALTVRAGDDTLEHRPLARSHGVRVEATRDSMSYRSDGLGYGAANLRLIVSRGSAADTITVSRLGRVRRR